MVYLRESGLADWIESDRESMRLTGEARMDLRDLIGWLQGQQQLDPSDAKKAVEAWRSGLLEGLTDPWLEGERFVLDGLVTDKITHLSRTPGYETLKNSLAPPPKRHSKACSPEFESELFHALKLLGGSEASPPALELFHASLPYFALSSQIEPALEWTQQALARLKPDDPRSHGLRLDRIDLLGHGNQFALAMEEAGSLAGEATDPEIQAVALVKAAGAALRALDVPAARSLAKRALTKCRSLGLASHHLNALVSLVGTALLADDHEQCVKLGTATALSPYAKLPPGADTRMGVGYDEIVDRVRALAEAST